MRCKSCKKKFTPRYFLQKHCLTNDECIKAMKDEAVEKERKKKAKEWRKEKKALKEKIKTASDYYQETLKAFNAYIRERDRLQPCISCDAPAGSYRITSGHYFPQGTHRNIALDVANAHGQCWYNCNKNKHGNLAEYHPRLVEKIGEQGYKDLIERKNTPKHYSIPELIELKIVFKDKLKTLKNGRDKKKKS